MDRMLVPALVPIVKPLPETAAPVVQLWALAPEELFIIMEAMHNTNGLSLLRESISSPDKL